MSTALAIDGLAKSFGALRATDGVTLSFDESECHAIIGPNGAGKSTLIGQITGEIVPDAGAITFFGENMTRWSVQRRALAGLARSFQITQLCAGFSALDNVAFWAMRAATSACASRRLRRWRALASRSAPTRMPQLSPMANAAILNSPSPWRCSRACSCWMSPWRAWALRKASA